MFTYVSQELQKEGTSMEMPEIMENINIFVILVGEARRADR